MPARKNLQGKSFGRWTVENYGGPGTCGATWYCKCDCGTLRRVNANSLLSGASTSCGCSGAEALAKRATVHGHNTKGQSETYKRWRNMLSRCNDPSHTSFRNYGAKGITVDPRWAKSFVAFLEDMGECPKGKTLDRIDGTKGYCKDNCRWFTMKEQGNNRNNNRYLTFRGETRNVVAWAEILGIKEGTIRARLSRGATDEDALR